MQYFMSPADERALSSNKALYNGWHSAALT